MKNIRERPSRTNLRPPTEVLLRKDMNSQVECRGHSGMGGEGRNKPPPLSCLGTSILEPGCLRHNWPS